MSDEEDIAAAEDTLHLHTTTNVTAVALKLPPVWTDDIEGWFLHIESQFAIKKITDSHTKFQYVVSTLSSATSASVRHLLRRPDATYNDIKAALTAKFELSPWERAARIRAITSLGGSKPSEVMDRMLLLLGNDTAGLLFLHHFLSILPEFVRSVLSVSSETDPQRLAAEADKIFLQGAPAPVSTVCDVSSDVHDTVNAVGHGRAGRAASTRDLCYYHKNYGVRATKCRKPCAWVPNSGNAAGGRQ